MKKLAIVAMFRAADLWVSLTRALRSLTLPVLLVSFSALSGCAVDIKPACEAYREAVGPEVIEYVNADGVIDDRETTILRADSEFQMQIKSGPSVAQAKAYSANVGGPWLVWVDADAKLDAAKKKRRHNTKEDFDRATQAVETGK